MEFCTYISRLSEALGEAQLPLNPKWSKACEIVDADAVHHDLISHFLRDVYRAGHCSKGTDHVSLHAVLDCLGQLRYELCDGDSPDLDAVRLVERIGEISVTLFTSVGTPDGPPDEPRLDPVHGTRRHRAAHGPS